MTIRDAHRLFDIILDKVDSNLYPEITSAEKDEFINNAIESFVKTRYNKNNIYQAGFEEIQKRTEDLRTLVKTGFPELSEIAYSRNTYKADVDSIFTNFEKTELFNDTYWFYLKSSAYITNDPCGELISETKLVQQDDLNRVLKDPFNKPNKNRVIIYFEDGSIFITVDDTSVLDNFKITFLKKPNTVSVNLADSSENSDIQFDLPEHTHREIIKLAVKEAIEAIESPRVQTYLNTLQTIE